MYNEDNVKENLGLKISRLCSNAQQASEIVEFSSQLEYPNIVQAVGACESLDEVFERVFLNNDLVRKLAQKDLLYILNTACDLGLEKTTKKIKSLCAVFVYNFLGSQSDLNTNCHQGLVKIASISSAVKVLTGKILKSYINTNQAPQLIEFYESMLKSAHRSSEEEVVFWSDCLSNVIAECTHEVRYDFLKQVLSLSPKILEQFRNKNKIIYLFFESTQNPLTLEQRKQVIELIEFLLEKEAVSEVAASSFIANSLRVLEPNNQKTDLSHIDVIQKIVQKYEVMEPLFLALGVCNAHRSANLRDTMHLISCLSYTSQDISFLSQVILEHCPVASWSGEFEKALNYLNEVESLVQRNLLSTEVPQARQASSGATFKL